MPGMVLASTVYDSKGYPVVSAGEHLTEAALPELGRSCSSEILVDDPLTGDILVNSVFPADLEAKTVQALAVVAAAAQGEGGVHAGGLQGLTPLVNKMVACVYPYLTGDADISGSHALEGYHHIHAVKTAELSLAIGRLAGLEKDDLTSLALAALLMNLGYHALPAGLLDQPRELTPEDRELVALHPRRSMEALAASGLPRDAFVAIAQHHERHDGSGYPAGRRGGDIALFGRIIAIADTYVSLRSRRPHRDAFRPHEAIEFVIAFSGQLFDPELAQVVVRQIPQYPTGVSVVLNSGEAGVVSTPNVGHVARPVVRVCAINGAPQRKPYDVDLTSREHQAKLVVAVDM
jgi:HD-GYP domain-containing protein (c-di-GMP phosphodiesterase class II)